MSHVLVIGGCGFIGSHIVDSLSASGHRITVLDHNKEQFRPPLDGVDYYHENIGTEGLLGGVIGDVDTVIHTASSTTPATSNDDPLYDVEFNLLELLKLLECMRKNDKKRIVFLSSGGTVYGSPKVIPTPESHALAPKCSYAAVKIAMEHYLGIYAYQYGFNTTIIRPANPYGPRQSYRGNQGVIANFTAKAIRNETLTLWGNGNTVRDFIHISDLASLCIALIERNITGVFNAGSGQGHSVREVIDTLEQIHGSQLKQDLRPSRAFDIPEIILDISKAQQELSWRPTISLYNGMSDYYCWLKNTLSTEE